MFDSAVTHASSARGTKSKGTPSPPDFNSKRKVPACSYRHNGSPAHGRLLVLYLNDWLFHQIALGYTYPHHCSDCRQNFPQQLDLLFWHPIHRHYRPSLPFRVWTLVTTDGPSRFQENQYDHLPPLHHGRALSPLHEAGPDYPPIKSGSTSIPLSSLTPGRHSIKSCSTPTQK